MLSFEHGNGCSRYWTRTARWGLRGDAFSAVRRRPANGVGRARISTRPAAWLCPSPTRRGTMAENPADSDPRQSIRQRVFVIGAGIMGSGIAAQCALAGYAVTLEDVSDELVQRGRANLQRALDAGVAKGRIPASDSSDALANIDLAIGLRRLDSADWVIEAAPENLALKRQLFRDIELASKPGALLATNTSSLPITSIASTMKEPERLVGIHFFNPVLQMPLVEIIPGSAVASRLRGCG